MSWSQTLKRFFAARKQYCSFCGKHYGSVAKLIAGSSCSICNECVLICSGVLMKECPEYRQAQLDRMRDFAAANNQTESAATPKSAAAAQNPMASGKPPSVS